MDEISTVKKNILYFIESQGIRKEEFFKNCGLSYSNFKGKSLYSELSADKLVRILTVYDKISPDWILTGNGDMFRSEKKEILINEVNGEVDYRLIIEEQKNIIASLKDQIEFYKTQHTTDAIEHIKHRTDDIYERADSIYEFITTQEALREFDKIFEKAVQVGKEKAKEKGLDELMHKIEALRK